MKKIFLVLLIARQIYGEWILAMPQRAFDSMEKANELLYVLKEQYAKNGEAVPVSIKTEFGEVVCFCEVAVHEIEYEQGE